MWALECFSLVVTISKEYDQSHPEKNKAYSSRHKKNCKLSVYGFVCAPDDGTVAWGDFAVGVALCLYTSIKKSLHKDATHWNKYKYDLPCILFDTVREDRSIWVKDDSRGSASQSITIHLGAWMYIFFCLGISFLCIFHAIWYLSRLFSPSNAEFTYWQ